MDSTPAGLLIAAPMEHVMLVLIISSGGHSPVSHEYERPTVAADEIHQLLHFDEVSVSICHVPLRHNTFLFL